MIAVMTAGLPFLTACSTNPIQVCAPVPEWVLAVPEKPKCVLKDPTTRDQMACVLSLDEWADLLERRIRAADAHQEPCR